MRPETPIGERVSCGRPARRSVHARRRGRSYGLVEMELRERRDSLLKIEERVVAKEDDIDRKLTELARREQGLADREVHLRQLQEELKLLKDGQRKELERIASMTTGEARARLLEESQEEVRHELAGRVRQMEEEAATEAKRR